MKRTKVLSLVLVFLLAFSLLSLASLPVLAAETESDAAEVEMKEMSAETESGAEESVVTTGETASADTGVKAIVAAATVGAAAAVGAVGMALVISKCAGAMARQPEAAGNINSAMMLGLVFIETAIIYALIIAILVIFVL